MTEFGKREVRTRDYVPVLRGVIEAAPVLLFGPHPVDVVGNRDGRIGELHRGDMDDIAPQEQLFALTLHFEHRVSGGMSVGRPRTC